MASASVTLPDQTSVSINRRGVIPQAADRPNARDGFSLDLYFMGQEWRYSAACRDVPTELFFPDRGIPGEKIRDLCFSCPVRLECLEDSVDVMPKYGWVGGHPKEGRTKVRKLMREGYDLETADALVLADALEKVRQRRKDEKVRRFDREMGEPIIGEHVLVAS